MDLTFCLTLIAALGSGLMGGVFFAFSALVMRALARLPAASAISAMQSINEVAVKPWFLAFFLGTAAATALLAGVSILSWQRDGSAWRLAGSLLYVGGVFAVTVVGNIPRNNALARVDPVSAGADARWAQFATGWTRWNHVRAMAGIVAAGLLILALRQD